MKMANIIEIPINVYESPHFSNLKLPKLTMLVSKIRNGGAVIKMQPFQILRYYHLEERNNK